MQVIIMAGGKGKRLRPLTDNLPKPLLPINGRPLIDLLIEHAARNGADNIIVCTGYLADKIAEHIDKQGYGLLIREARETKPLGTAGPLLPIKEELEDEFFVLYGDVYTTVDLRRMLDFHRQKGADATLLLHTSDHPQDSTVVTVDNKSRITNFTEKPGSEWKKHGSLTSAALYVMSKDALKFIDAGKAVDFAKDVFPRMLREGVKLYGYVSDEYTRDMGTAERYREVEEYDAAAAKKREKRIAAFIDRDGTINEEVNLLTRKEQLKLTKGAAEGIRMLNTVGILAIITTNQPVVARNLVTEEQLGEIHDTLLEMLEKGYQGTYHAAGIERVSKHTFALKAAEAFGLDKSLVKQGDIKKWAKAAEKTGLKGHDSLDSNNQTAWTNQDKRSERSKAVRLEFQWTRNCLIM